MENVKKFYEALATDESLKEKAAKFNEKSKDLTQDEASAKIIEFAAAEGYSFTAEDLKAYAGKQALDDDEMEAVAGGGCNSPTAGGFVPPPTPAKKDCKDDKSLCWKTCFCIAGGGGDHRTPKITCACVAGGGGYGCPRARRLICAGIGALADC